MTHVTCRLTAKYRDQLRTLCSVMEYGLPLPFSARVYLGAALSAHLQCTGASRGSMCNCSGVRRSVRVYRLPGRCVMSGVEELRQRVDAVVAVGSPVAARGVVVDRQLMLLLLLLLVLLTLGGHLGAVRLHHARCRLRRHRRRTLLARGRRRRRFARGLLIIIIIFLPNNS